MSRADRTRLEALQAEEAQLNANLETLDDALATATGEMERLAGARAAAEAELVAFFAELTDVRRFVAAAREEWERRAGQAPFRAFLVRWLVAAVLWTGVMVAR